MSSAHRGRSIPAQKTVVHRRLDAAERILRPDLCLIILLRGYENNAFYGVIGIVKLKVEPTLSLLFTQILPNGFGNKRRERMG